MLAVPGGHRRAIERLVGALPRPKEGRQCKTISSMSPVQERTRRLNWGRVGSVGEGAEQVGLGVAVEVPLAGEPGPPGEDGQGYDLAFGEGDIWSGPLIRPTGLAEVVGDDVECGEEGVHVDQESSVPFPKGLVGKPTLRRGHLSLKSSTGNSHQAFKTNHLGVLAATAGALVAVGLVMLLMLVGEVRPAEATFPGKPEVGEGSGFNVTDDATNDYTPSHRRAGKRM